MATWALLDDGEEITSFTGIDDEACREDCETRAIQLDLASRTKKGVALALGVEIICIDED